MTVTGVSSVLGPFSPGGRVTLLAGEPVLQQDVPSAAVVYYTAYRDGSFWLWDGTTWLPYQLGEGGAPAVLSLTLDPVPSRPGSQNGGGVFDLFIAMIDGVPRLVTGPPWASHTVRDYLIERRSGLWVNTYAMPVKIDATTARPSVGVHRALYVGTLLATANGLTRAVFLSPGAPGGADSVVGIFNAYNRQAITVVSRDLTFRWDNTIDDVWLPLNNSLKNRVTYVDGLGAIRAIARVTGLFSGSGHLGIGFNSATTPITGPFVNNSNASVSTAALFPALVGADSGAPGLIDGKHELQPGPSYNFGVRLGVNWMQALEFNDTSAGTFPSHVMTFYEGAQGLIVNLEY